MTHMHAQTQPLQEVTYGDTGECSDTGGCGDIGDPPLMTPPTCVGLFQSLQMVDTVQQSP